MRFIEFLTEGIAKKTYRSRRVSPLDAKWVREQVKRHVDTKGHHSWALKDLSQRRWLALVDFAQANKYKYYWGEDKYDFTMGLEPDMEEVDL